MKKILLLFIKLSICAVAMATVHGNRRIDRDSILKKVSDFGKSMRQHQKDTLAINMYTRYKINVHKRNPTLLVIPSMYPIAHGERKFAGESFYVVKMYDESIIRLDMIANIGTVPKRKETVSVMKNLMMPNIYGEMIYDGFILSPCNVYNKRLYRYYVAKLSGNRLELAFRPKVKNTQLISGRAVVDRKTGRIIYITYCGELDMVEFKTKIVMSKEQGSIIPSSSETDIKFKFVGNNITAYYRTHYNINTRQFDYMSCRNNDSIIDKLRPVPIGAEYIEIYRQREMSDKKDGNKGKASRKNTLGDYFVDRIKGNFGSKSQGAYHLSPLINPLYIGYSSTKGITYRIKLNGSYSFSENSSMSLSANIGYSFKQKHIYTKIPLRFTVGKSVYLESEFGSGNRITNSEILKKIKNERYDSIRWDDMNLEFFKDMYWKFRGNVTICRNWNLRPGVIYHRRAAVNKHGFELSDEPTAYKSFAPTLQIQFFPFSVKGPVVTLDYERGIKGVLESDMNYEKVEADMAWKRKLHSMRLLSMKAGFGFYTSRSKNSYFLDYANFRFENIPGGWDDDWTGEFQILNSNWYNASKYYTRGNLTYESPMLIISKLPFVGKYIETERIYANLLFTEYLHPYLEYGYGIKNKLFSAGLFCAVTGERFEGAGIRLGFEMFKDW